MFDYCHYVPVLRWRQAESLALSEVDQSLKSKLTPLIEMWPKDFDPRNRTINKSKVKVPVKVDDVLLKKVDELKNLWGTSPFFLDTNHYNNRIRTSQEELPILFMAKKAKVVGIAPIPVVGMSRTKEYIYACKSVTTYLKTGICIRIHPSDIIDLNFKERLQKMVSFFGIPLNQCDLIFDNQIVCLNSTDISQIFSGITDIETWRTFTLIGGAFPIDLSKYSVGSHMLERADYHFWLKQKAKTPIQRIPTFGDYTIQHPFLNDNLPPVPNPSASIRYTSSEHWVILRGEALHKDNGRGHAQYPANAEMLCNRDEYSGGTFSKGDAYIESKRMVFDKPGTPGTWLQAGINHHLSFVIQQLANLFGS